MMKDKFPIGYWTFVANDIGFPYLYKVIDASDDTLIIQDPEDGETRDVNRHEHMVYATGRQALDAGMSNLRYLLR